MNGRNEQLNQLLKSAARASLPLPVEAPFAVQAKVLAHWRRWPADSSDLAHAFLPLIRRAAVCACILMLLSLAFTYRTLSNPESEEVIIANSAVDLTLLP